MNRMLFCSSALFCCITLPIIFCGRVIVSAQEQTVAPPTALPAAALEKDTAKDPASVPEGINDRFKDPDLNVDEWLDRFEVESHEVYGARDAVLRAYRIG